MPFGNECEFPDMAACIAAHGDKDDPAAFCAELMRATEANCKARAEAATGDDKAVAPDGGLVHKIYEAKLDEMDLGQRQLIATISTAAPDSDDEVLLPSGARGLDLRPPVFWAHERYQLPVGMPLWIKYLPGLEALRAKLQFAGTAQARDVFSLYQGEFLRSFSVSFDTRQAKSRPPTAAERAMPGWENVRRVWTEWTLLEISCVPFGANPEALVIAVGKGLLTPTALRYVVKDFEPAEKTESPSPSPRCILGVVPAMPEPQKKSTRRILGHLTNAAALEQYMQDVVAASRGRCV